MTTEQKQAAYFSPGEYLADELAARGWTQTYFEQLTEISHEEMDGILSGTHPVTPDIALAFAWVLKQTSQTWLNLQAAWDKRPR